MTTVLASVYFADPNAFAVTAAEQTRCVRALVDHKRRFSSDDLLSDLLAARDGNDRLSESDRRTS